VRSAAVGAVRLHPVSSSWRASTGVSPARPA
jgi:hypothetical protein